MSDLKITVSLKAKGKNPVDRLKEIKKQMDNGELAKKYRPMIAEKIASETVESINKSIGEHLDNAYQSLLLSSAYSTGDRESQVEGMIRTCNLIAMVFQRIVARTPVDEDYEYDSRKRGHVKHFADDDVIKEQWKLEVTSSTGSAVSVNSKSHLEWFENVSIENGGNGYIEIGKLILDGLNGGTVTGVKITNSAPEEKFKALEYGTYGRSTGIHKGSQRSHGSMGGYSVQAPAGMVRLTISELQNLVSAAERNKADINAENMDKMLPRERQAEVQGGKITEFATQKYVEEKDIAEVLRGRKRKVVLDSRVTHDFNSVQVNASHNLRGMIMHEESNKVKQLVMEIQGGFIRTVMPSGEVKGKSVTNISLGMEGRRFSKLITAEAKKQIKFGYGAKNSNGEKVINSITFKDGKLGDVKINIGK